MKPELVETTLPTSSFRILREAKVVSGSTDNGGTAPSSTPFAAVADDALSGDVFVAKHCRFTRDWGLPRGDTTFLRSGFHAESGSEGARNASMGDDFVLRRASPIRCARMISVVF